MEKHSTKPEVALAAEIAYLLQAYLTPAEMAKVLGGHQPSHFMESDEMADTLEEAASNLGVSGNRNLLDAAWSLAVSVRFDASRMGVDARVTAVRASLAHRTDRVVGLTDAARTFLGAHAGGLQVYAVNFPEPKNIVSLMGEAGLSHYTSNSSM